MLANNDFNNLAKKKLHPFKKVILTCAVLSVSIPVFAQQTTTDSAGVFCSTVGAPLPQGSVGSEVAALQSLLRQKYAYRVAATGFFGPVTDYYVRALQKSLGVRNPSGALGTYNHGTSQE
jgi:peptidoglycan hydrolase-like protein with peptidoglycan-binding domain